MAFADGDSYYILDSRWLAAVSAESQKCVLQHKQQLANSPAAILHTANMQTLANMEASANMQTTFNASESLLASQYIVNASTAGGATSLMNALGQWLSFCSVEDNSCLSFAILLMSDKNQSHSIQVIMSVSCSSNLPVFVLLTALPSCLISSDCLVIPLFWLSRQFKSE
jgi:hypothetical protein